jgi:hypothetical protein
MRCPLILGVLLGTLAPGSSALAEVPRHATTPQIRQWIAQLDADEFAAREQAAARLASAGPSAIGPLAEGVVSLNPEVAWRCSETLERIAMEGDEQTMDQVVKVLSNLAAHGKPQLAQFAVQMRERQIVFRHNRAAAAIRQLGGQVAGGATELSESDMPVADLDVDVPAIAAVERFIIDEGPVFEVPAEPADPEAAGAPAFKELFEPEARPAWLKLLEALKIVEVKPALKGIHIDDGTDDGIELGDADADEMPDDDLDGKEDKPALADRVAAAMLPGKVGGALRHAFGLRRAKELGEKPAADDVAKDFSLPELEGAAEEAGEKAADAIEAADAVDAVEVVDFGVVGGPVFFGGGMVMSSDGSSPGYMMLGPQWRGGDAGLKHLKDLSGIATLQIDHAKLTDAALPHLAQMKSLTYVSIRGGNFSPEALRAFHRERPKVSLMAMGEGMMGVMAQFNTDGCILDSVQADTAAQEAGLQAGDKVISIAGEPIADFSELTIAVSTRKPGDKLKIVYERGGERRQTDLTLKARPAGQ